MKRTGNLLHSFLYLETLWAMLGNPAGKVQAVKWAAPWSIRHARADSDVSLNGMGRCALDKLDFASSASAQSVLKG